MGVFKVLYIDMNSFFASVEQQLDPRLRRRPVAITAVDAHSGACVADSYEAKALGDLAPDRPREGQVAPRT